MTREEKAMEIYQVFYWIKKDKKEYLEHIYVSANNARDAVRVCKQRVREQTGRNAFRPTSKAPDLSEYRGNPNFVID